jgi:hypothetical protein
MQRFLSDPAIAPGSNSNRTEDAEAMLGRKGIASQARGAERNIPK